MANGYDTHSLAATGLEEASSSSVPMVAVRDKRFTKSGIGFRSQDATTLNPGAVGQAPPPIMYPQGYPGGVATRKRGQVDESRIPWETAQEATSPQIRPRDTLPPWASGMRENDDWGGGWDGEDCDTGFPDEEDARDALGVLSQFADPSLVKSVQAAIVKQFGDPAAEPGQPADASFMGEAAKKAPPFGKDGKKASTNPDDYALPGRKFLIDTPENARASLKRVKIFGSPEDQRKVKAAVQKKYPKMKIS